MKFLKNRFLIGLFCIALGLTVSLVAIPKLVRETIPDQITAVRLKSDLKAGEEVLLNGVIYTARDKVHQLLSSPDMEWPFSLTNNAIYYCGPTPASDKFPMGSCGPTTSSRMDQWSEELYLKGLAATIGKGPRSNEVSGAIEKAKAVYFVAFGGCGALYGKAVKKVEIIAFEELGP